MRAYARHQGTQASVATLKADLKNNDTAALDDDTISSYLEALRKIFVVEDMPAWNPNLRSKTAIRTADTRYFVDPSIATAALGLGPADLMNDLKTMGFFFEAMCVRDLRVFAEALMVRYIIIGIKAVWNVMRLYIFETDSMGLLKSNSEARP